MKGLAPARRVQQVQPGQQELIAEGHCYKDQVVQEAAADIEHKGLSRIVILVETPVVEAAAFVVADSLVKAEAEALH